MKRQLLVGGLAIVSGSLLSMGAKADPPEIKDQLPRLTDAVQYQNQWCTYKDTMPFVENVNWNDPLIARAGRAFGLVLTDDGIKDRVVELGFMSQADADAAFAAYDGESGFGSYLVAEGKLTDAQLETAQVDGVGASRSTMTYSDHLTVYKLNRAGDWGSNNDYYELVSSFNGLDWELSRINRERDDLKSDLAAGSITQYKFDKEMEELDGKEASARKLEDMGEEGRAAEMEKIDEKVARGNYENFIRSLLGEFRDYPYMIKVKLEILADHTPVAQDEPQPAPEADEAWLFDTLTGPGYARMRWLLSNVFQARESRLHPNGQSRFNYNWNTTGHGANRVDHSVAPFTHAEMRYMYTEWLSGEEKKFDADKFEEGLAKFIETQCDSSPNGPDLGYSYDFRGHKNFKANWMECNGFIWNSRDAARVFLGQLKDGNADPSYYQRPFATRYERTKMLMGAYLYYPGRHHQYMRQASQSGGGPHLYVDNVDSSSPQDGVADYRLFPNKMGQGDIGLGSQALEPEQVAAGENTTDAVWSFNRTSFNRFYDWGFNRIFKVTADNADKWAEDAVFDADDVGNTDNLEWGPETWNGNVDRATYKLRMARLCQALDRHTNWGPTHMFSSKAAELGLWKGHQVRGAYSPIVAMSYEISKSHSFATGNYPATHPKDSGKTKLMFIVKFKTRYYYDERHVAKGWYINWDRSYLNESSLSNDYYHERALDKFGYIPASDMHTASYLAEANGEQYYSPSFDAPVGGSGFTQTLNGQ